jgi:hypothetical protein
MGYDYFMSNIKKNLNQVRQKIENAMEQAEEDHNRRLQAHRMELARAGIAAAQNKQIEIAVKAFQSYIRILEEAKGVREGGLIPANFDRSREMAEMLMLSGVYWDLVKIYDMTKSQDRQRVFHRYLEKFILFSKGMPYQALCTEMVRKYLNNEKPFHRSEFKNAFRMLGGNTCFVASSLVDVIDEPTLPRLRAFRDQVLRIHPRGRKFIAWYYKKGPSLADRIDQFPQGLRWILGKILNWVARLSTILVNDRSDSFRSKSELTIGETDPK